MPQPTPTTIDLPAGFLKDRGPLESSGRYVDGQWVRFRQGKPEKIGGYISRTSVPLVGIPRALVSWNDLTSRTLTAIGTTSKLYAVDSNNTVPQDITPFETTVDLTAAFSTTNGSDVVTVTSPAHGMSVGQVFVIVGGPTVGGLDMSGTWQIVAPVTFNTFAFVHTAAATSTAGPAGDATLQYEIPPGRDIPSSGFGWGVGPWGAGTWGTPRPTSNIFVEPTTWTLDHFGQLLLANQSNGPLYSWDPTVLPFVRAGFLAEGEAPARQRGFFVTPERFVVSYGCSRIADGLQDNMNLRWCDQNIPTSWTPSTTGTAGERRLTEGKKIIAGAPFAFEVALIWTDTTLYTHTFTGSQFVFTTEVVASESGLAGPHAFTFARGAAFWLGNGAFQQYSGGVGLIQNSGEISDYIFENLRSGYEAKTVSFFVPKFNEVWWIIVPADDTEPALYAAVNLEDWSWITGSLLRTAASRQPDGDYRPVLADRTGMLWTHETGVDAAGVAIEAYIRSGVFEVGEGVNSYEVLGMIPDFERIAGNLDLELYAYDRSNDPGPVDAEVAQFEFGDGLIDLRLQGRLLSFLIRSNAQGGDFRFGKHQFEVCPAGARR